MRMIVDLPEDQLAAVANICERNGISQVEALHQAVADFLKKHQVQLQIEAFGAWKGKKDDSRPFVKKLRSEWR